jgi:uncharacterized Tic20 family protein
MSEQPSAFTSDERTMAVLAHASGLLNLVSGMGGLIGAGIIWLIQREKSPWSAFHGLQSLLFQAVVVVISGAIVALTWVPGFIFSFITIGIGTILAVPFMILTMFLALGIVYASVGYQVYAAVQVNNGKEFTYPWVGTWLKRQLK